MSEFQTVADLSRKYGIQYRNDAYKRRGAVAEKLNSIEEKILKRTDLVIEIPKELYAKRKVGTDIGYIDIASKKAKLDRSGVTTDQYNLSFHNSSSKISKQFSRRGEEKKVADENLPQKENTEQSYQDERLIKKGRVSKPEHVHYLSRSGKRFSESNKDDVGINTNVSSPTQPLSAVNLRSLLNASQYGIQYRNDGYKRRGALGEKFNSIQEKISKRANLVIEIPKELYAKRKVDNGVGDVGTVFENSKVDESAVVTDQENTGQNKLDLHNSSIKISKEFRSHDKESKVFDENLPTEKETTEQSVQNELSIKQERVSEPEYVNVSSHRSNNVSLSYKNDIRVNTDVPSRNRTPNVVNSKSLHDDSQFFAAPDGLDGETAFSPKTEVFEDADVGLSGTSYEEIHHNLQNTTALAVQFLREMKPIKSISQTEKRISDFITLPKANSLGRLELRCVFDMAQCLIYAIYFF